MALNIQITSLPLHSKTSFPNPIPSFQGSMGGWAPDYSVQLRGQTLFRTEWKCSLGLVYCWSMHFSYVRPTKESSTWTMLSYFLLPEWPDSSENMSLYSLYLFGTLEEENWKLKCNYHFSYSVLPRCISLICVANVVAENGKMSRKFAIFFFHDDVQLINNIISCTGMMNWVGTPSKRHPCGYFNLWTSSSDQS